MIITETITFTATNFFLSSTGILPPVDPVTGVITYSFEQVTILSAHLDSINIMPSDQPAIFRTFATQHGQAEGFCWGWQPSPDCGSKPGTNSFFLGLTGPLDNPAFSSFTYSQTYTPNNVFSTHTGSVQIVPLAEAGWESLVMLVALAAIYLRRSK